MEHDGGFIKLTESDGNEYRYDKKVLSGDLSLNDLLSYGIPAYVVRHIKKLREEAASLPDV
jgi:hypothetical protein